MESQITPSMIIRLVSGINFLKDFCSDKSSHQYANKLTVAAILWKEVRDSKDEKVYSKQLLKEHSHKIEVYLK